MHESIKPRTSRKRFGLAILTVAFAAALAASMALVGCSSPSSSSSQSSASSQSMEAHESTNYGNDSSSSDVQAGQIAVTVAIAPEGDINTGTVEEVVIPEDSSAYDALAATSADVQATDGEHGKFVESINGLKNGSKGASTGWVFTVNGQEIIVSCDEFKLKNGDVVEWSYTSM